jgi:hypothetical protein
MPADNGYPALIDRLLEARKTLEGHPEWRDVEQHGEARIVWPILAAGEISEVTYQLTAYPRKRPAGFRILLCARYAVWRLDFDCEPSHVNSLDRPSALRDYAVGARHYHAWNDNRHFATTRSLPRYLLNARNLPRRIRSFQQAQRWFCAQTKIQLRPADVVDLPPSDLLL